MNFFIWFFIVAILPSAYSRTQHHKEINKSGKEENETLSIGTKEDKSLVSGAKVEETVSLPLKAIGKKEFKVAGKGTVRIDSNSLDLEMLGTRLKIAGVGKLSYDGKFRFNLPDQIKNVNINVDKLLPSIVGAH
ncbi:unnamed protein product [Phyllotreta striolata]|uniref:Uncharacterized protein n=1 Tax=Phyllotreta striolata TaxID=444603 RepID=A0A9N9XM48_PHYSR|nr:unnamed protein product [Phyllotreta striolata]